MHSYSGVLFFVPFQMMNEGTVQEGTGCFLMLHRLWCVSRKEVCHYGTRF